MRHLLTFLGVCLATCSPAQARGLDIARPLGGGPVVAGRGAAWTEFARHGTLVRRADTRGAARTLFTTASLGSGWGIPRIAGSATRLAFEVEACRIEGRGYRNCDERLRAGAPGGPFAVTAGYDDSFELDCIDQFDVRADALVRFDCDHKPVIEDLAAGTERALTFQPVWTESPVQIASRFVAWVEVTDGPPSQLAVVVFDARAGREAYRSSGYDGQVLRFDLQDDGKIAVVQEVGGPGRYEVAWHSPAAPRAHRLSRTVRRPAVRMAGDRIVFDRRLGGRSHALVAADLDGGIAEVARFGPGRRGGRERTGSFDFAGDQVVWATRRWRWRRLRHGTRLIRRRGRQTVAINSRRLR